MYTAIFVVTFTLSATPPTLENARANPERDARLLPLFDEKVRTNKHRLTVALDDIWKMLPDPVQIRKTNHSKVAEDLAWFITLDSPTVDERELAVRNGNGLVVSSIIEHIGLPAIPILLEQLESTEDDTKENKRHRLCTAYCILRIYEKGGEGQELAAARIKLAADKKGDPKKKALLMKVLDYKFLKPPTLIEKQMK